MPFKKGNPGKPKGTKSYRTKEIEEITQRLKVNPFEILCLFAKGDWKRLGYDNECWFSEGAEGQTKMGYTITPDMRLIAAKEATKYLYAAKKSVEVTANVNQTNQSEDEEVKELYLWLKSLKEMK